MITSHPNLLSLNVTMVSHVIIDVLPNNPFRIKVGNFSMKPIQLLEQMYFCIDVDVQNRIVSFFFKPEDSVNAVPHEK